MRLIHVKQARSVWLFDLQDLNPTGRDILAELMTWIQETYSFSSSPDPSKQAIIGVPQTGLAFQGGSYQTQEGSFAEISTLTLYNDGIVVDTTSSTDVADRFTEELLGVARREFDLTYEPTMIRRRMYISSLVVRSDLSLSAIHPGLLVFAQRLSEAIAEATPCKLELAGLAFWSDPNDSGAHKTFTFVPQAGKHLSEHRYFSEAPLRTSEHLRLLGELEQCLAPE